MNNERVNSYETHGYASKTCYIFECFGPCKRYFPKTLYVLKKTIDFSAYFAAVLYLQRLLFILLS